MTDKEKWISFLNEFNIKFEDYKSENINSLDFEKKCDCSYGQKRTGCENCNIINRGDGWAGFEVYFDNNDKFKYIEISGD